MLFVSLLMPVLGCTPAVDSGGSDGDPEDTADTADTQDTGGGNSLDPMVNNSIPDSYPGATPTRVVFLGDSITAGNGATKAKLAYPRLLEDNDDANWADYAEVDLPGLFGEAPEIVDVSVPGATTSSLVGQQLPNVTEALGDTVSGPTAVVVTIAGNDVQSIILTPNKLDATIEKVLENLGEFYDYFQDPERFPDGSFIYLANVYEPSDGVGQADECFAGLNLETALPSLEAVNAATLEQAQERGVAWIDIHGHFLGHGYHASDPENPYYEEADSSLWFADDCIHPNDRGHHELRRLYWYALAGQPFPGDEPIAE